MIEPSLELQKAVRLRLVASSALVAMVPAANIVDKNGLPAVFPCILIGEGQTIGAGDVARRRHACFLDLHCWVKETGLVASKQIAGAVRAALADAVWNVPSMHIADLHISSSRFLRDPNGTTSHAVLSLEAICVEVA